MAKRLILWFVVFNIMDVITTMLGLLMGATEQNPIPEFMGWPLFFVLKLFIVPTLLYLIWRRTERKFGGEAMWAMWVLPISLALVALWNSTQVLLLAWGYAT